MKLPRSIEKAVDGLKDLPSIGPRQAIRLAFYLISSGRQSIGNLSSAIESLADVKICDRCFFIHQNEGPICDICKNPARAQNIIMIVEKETDLISLENTGKFRGRYFVIGEIPKTGMLDDTQKIRLQSLKNFIGHPAPEGLGGKAEEIILGFNPTALGDFQSSLIMKELAPLAKRISRLGRGLPTGGEIEFADEDTLSASMESRN